MYRSDWSLKPNGEAYNDIVFGEWWTEEMLTSDMLGEVMMRAFKGQHLVNVEFGGVSESRNVSLADDGLSLEINLPLLLGDYNHDGLVDAADFSVWRDALGSTSNLTADGNNNGIIDAGDFDVWVTNFGRSADLAVRIPEPSSYGMLIVAAPLLGLLRRRMHATLI